jgi:hypothetical protein
MKGKKYTTEDKIRILREADAGKSILEVFREHNISEAQHHGDQMHRHRDGIASNGELL